MDPQIQEYMQKGARNLRLANDLHGAGLRYPAVEWVAIMAFYAAVHFVNAYYWHRAQHDPGDHAERNRWVRREAMLQPIRNDFTDLYVLSRLVRYETRYTFNASEAADAIAKAQVIGNHIQGILPTP